ncbi:MAG TPA: DUF6212 domain-containing protein [Stellaceae bacterium]|nr:DUF6212 domain-containing protein [Stellaceae bacterium]
MLVSGGETLPGDFACEPLRLLAFRWTADGSIEVYDGGQQLGAFQVEDLAVALGPLVGVLGAKGQEVATERLVEALGRLGGAYRDLPVWTESGDERRPADFLGQLRDDVYATLSLRLAETYRALAVLRREHADSLTAFTALEEFVGRSGVKLPDPAFRWEPDGRIHVEEVERTVARATGKCVVLVQRLPVASRGLARVDIACVGPGAAAPFSAELATLEGDERIARWALPAAQAGDLVLRLERAVDGLPQTVELRIEAENPRDLARFALGEAHPIDEFCAELREPGRTAGRRLAAPLAMTIWHAPPGMRIPEEEPPPPRPLAELPGAALRTVETQRLRQVRVVTKPPAGLTFNPITFWAEMDGVLVHPLPDRLMVAQIPEALGEAARHVSVLVQHEHGSGDTVECAAVLAAADLGPNQVSALLSGRRGAGFSGWQLVGPKEHTRLEIVAANPAHRALYFATRVPSGRDNRFAWAIFKRVDYLPAPAKP